MKSSFVERGGRWVVGQSVLMLAVILLGVKGDRAIQSTGGLYTGWGLMFVGAWFGVAGVAVLKGNRTAYPKPREDSQLVQVGVYSWVRHPLYTSVILISVGWALTWGSAGALVTAVLLVPFFYAKARREERWLREKFPGFGAYEERVPYRFLPRIW